MEASLAAQVTTSPDVLFQEVGGEALLLDLKGETYFGLDEVGTRIWQLLQDQSSLRSVYETLLGEYQVKPERLESDLLQHLGELAAAGLVRIDAADVTPA
ncbi:MAG: PqqD family protein [Bdellovibrio bacteriovorus]